jgi:hypothetical protein
MQTITQFIKKHYLIFIGIAVGAIGGYLYWSFVGCSSGHCPITSSPINSTLYGGVMGGLLLSMVKKKNKEENTENE